MNRAIKAKAKAVSRLKLATIEESLKFIEKNGLDDAIDKWVLLKRLKKNLTNKK